MEKTHHHHLFNVQMDIHCLKHKLGYVHRDVKAENVLLLSEDRLKLADFGFSTQLVNGRFYTFIPLGRRGMLGHTIYLNGG